MNNELLAMIESRLDGLIEKKQLIGKYIVIFGMNHPGDFIIRHLKRKGIKTNAVIDNNKANNGIIFEGIPVMSPKDALSEFNDNVVVLICSRYYAEMRKQLEDMGYKNDIHILKILDMNSGSNYSLDDKVFKSKSDEALRGAELAEKIISDFKAEALFVCPVKANGDVYMACSFLNAYMSKHSIEKYALALIGNACSKVAGLFGFNNIYIANQEEINLLTATYRMLPGETKIKILQPYWNYSSFISRLDCYKGLNFCDFYKYMIFGLNEEDCQEKPISTTSIDYIKNLFKQNNLKKGKTVILSPYANSLSALPEELLEKLTEALKAKGICVATNVAGEEKAISGTVPLSFSLSDIIPIVEYAGGYLGIRNGLSELLSSAICTKVILYPQKSYGFGTVRDLYSITAIGSTPVFEMIYDGDSQRCIKQAVDYFSESGFFE